MNRLARPIARHIAGILALGLAAPAFAGDSWTRTSDVGPNPLSDKKHETFQLGAGGRVEVENIGGSVKVEAVKGSAVELDYERRAATEQDMACETLRHELRDGRLRIWVEARKERACRVIRADDHLTLRVPRDAELSISSVGDSVHVTGVEGLVRVNSVGDAVVLSGVSSVEAGSIGDSLKLDVARVGTAGIRIDSVGDEVELILPERIDARLRISSVGDEVTWGGRTVLDNEDGEHDYERVLGKGGPLIRISSVGDSVTIRGPKP